MARRVSLLVLTKGPLFAKVGQETRATSPCKARPTGRLEDTLKQARMTGVLNLGAREAATAHQQRPGFMATPNLSRRGRVREPKAGHGRCRWGWGTQVGKRCVCVCHSPGPGSGSQQRSSKCNDSEASSLAGGGGRRGGYGHRGSQVTGVTGHRGSGLNSTSNFPLNAISPLHTHLSCTLNSP